jgi:16S rRNA (guanine966-N2)-methyltransferase
VIAGSWRGRALTAPSGRATRPTSDRAREGLFSMLTSRIGSFEGLQVADLFAGTGSLGIEALSRGAAACTFYETDRAALSALRENLERLGASGRADIRAQPVEHAMAPDRPCDLIMMDPPYSSALAQVMIDRIADAFDGARPWLAPGGWISIETAGESLAFPAALSCEAERWFGKAHLRLVHRHA